MKFGIVSSVVLAAILTFGAVSYAKSQPAKTIDRGIEGKACHSDQDCPGHYYCSGGSYWTTGTCTRLGWR